MPKFLDILTDEIKTKFGNHLSEICVVFSSRRACLHFKKILGTKFDKPVFAPDVFSIEDFFANLSSIKLSPRLDLIFILYDTYRKHIPGSSFDDFYPWGEIMLTDFDDIDRNLADASRLFTVIKNIKEIEDRFGGLFEENEYFLRFWRSFSNAPPGEAAKSFLKFWRTLGIIYTDFKKELRRRNTAYQGMLQRDVYEKLADGKLELKWNMVIFAGLNFLFKSERKLLQRLLDANKALIYWDADSYYIANPKMEAGHFIRRNIEELRIKEPKWLGNSLQQLPGKNVKIIGATLAAGQAKTLGKLLADHANEFGDEDIVVVLPEEKLLQPVLHSIPPEVKEFNITMGYPFRYTQFFSLFSSLRLLHKNAKSEGPVRFYHKDVISVLLHPYIFRLAPKEFSKAANEILQRNLIYLNPEQILSPSYQIGDPAPRGRGEEKLSLRAVQIVSTIFTHPSDENECLQYVKSILSLLYVHFISKAKWRTEVEHFNVLSSNLNRFEDLLGKHRIELDTDGFWKLFIEMLRSLTINFTGEPLKGLQIMGLLETRALSFKNVFILSLNEGILPGGYTNGSFIPYSLRKFAGLMTYDEHDAASAYNLYRMLQSAENVYLIYNTEVDEFNAGEKSRFILQLENELLKGKQEYLAAFKNTLHKINPISIPKSEEIMKELYRMDYLSVSSLRTYINCPLKFYFQKIRKLEEEEEVAETLTAANFGTVLHEIMAKLYGEYTGKQVTNSDLDGLLEKLQMEYDSMFDDAVKRIYKHSVPENAGMNRLFKEIIRKLAEKILENDRKEIPFRIIALEKELTYEINVAGKSLTLKGTADRIDLKNDSVRIIDYKTGKLDNKARTLGNDFDTALDRCFSMSEFKDWLQVYLYTYMYSQGKPMPGNLQACIYPLKRLGDGILYAVNGNIPKSNLEKFGDRLTKTLDALFNPGVPFTQTPLKKNCEYCSFAGMCYRD
jgi:CRISPR/Cas system-associated exonuclease Cas4 (RecB family)